MRARRILSVMSPALLFFGCDFLASQYQQGYNCGYGTVDAYYNCAQGCEQQRQERQEEVAVWDDACGRSVTAEFPDQNSLDRANDECSTSGTRGIVICDDVGQELGTEPSDCSPFDPPALGVPVRGNYECPSSVSSSNVLCLCCSDAQGATCNLPGGFCREDARCCSGRCQLEMIDAGFVDDAGTIPFPNSGTCD